VIPTDDTGLAGPLGDELRAAATLADAAGVVVARMRLGTDASLGVEMKPGDEPVTLADRAASDLIVAGLAQAFPDDIVISEERADNLARLGARRVWYVDPIDGTKDFIRGSEGFAVMIGLCVDGVPLLGVVHQPRGGRTFWATPAGAWTSAPGSAPARLASHTRTRACSTQ
jgi:3'-phosphoadenosine 5'-phosphosulfate (PAPS) 3'-phosphatase